MTTSSQVTGKELPVRSISRRGRVRPQRDFAAMEQRRMRAVALFERGGLPPWTRVVHLARPVGLDLAAAGAASRRTQRCGYRALGQAAVAATEKKGTAPERADRVRGRVWRVPVAIGAGDLGATRPHASPEPSVQLETVVPGRCTCLRT